jgi:hypothetical protein
MYPVEEILAAAADLRRSRRAAATARRRRERTEATLPSLAEAERRARDLADLAAAVTHVIDGVPLSVVADSRNPEAIVINNLFDRRRWASYLPHRGGFRLFPSRFGDYGSTPHADFDDAGAAEAAAIRFVIHGEIHG